MDKTKKIEKIIGSKFFVLEDGEYDGKWGGYIVEVNIKGENYRIETVNGVRGIDVPCTVVIKNGEVWIK